MPQMPWLQGNIRLLIRHLLGISSRYDYGSDDSPPRWLRVRAPSAPPISKWKSHARFFRDGLGLRFKRELAGGDTYDAGNTASLLCWPALTAIHYDTSGDTPLRARMILADARWPLQ